jgi:hypothetical protein
MAVKSEPVVSVQATVDVPEQRIADLLETGLYGSSWFGLTKINYPAGVGKDTDYTLVPLMEGGHLVITDYSVEEEGEKPVPYTLDRAALLRGLQLFANLKPQRHWAAFIEENDDQETGDVFLQLCLFGEVLYG